MEPIRIVLADDHSLVREGTRRILEQYPDTQVVDDAADGEEAVDLIARLRPQVAILDIRMPKLSGVEVVRRISQCSPETKALMLTAYDDDDYILALMEAGAAGYLLKTARPRQLIDAVRTVHQGEAFLDPAIAAKVARLWAHGRSPPQETPESLSPRELEVLSLAARGLRNKLIAERLNISVRTVEGHFNNILAKLGVSSRMEAVLCAASHHWITLEERDS
ncbi:MAG: response regulator transcription factor [SAR202 cluster bacterium]|nr:response regulator transcription factor [SAR202 cluster bacterium]